MSSTNDTAAREVMAKAIFVDWGDGNLEWEERDVWEYGMEDANEPTCWSAADAALAALHEAGLVVVDAGRFERLWIVARWAVSGLGGDNDGCRQRLQPGDLDPLPGTTQEGQG